MTQFDFPTVDTTPVTGTSGATLGGNLNSWKPALLSNHAGASRPSGAVADQIWIKTVSATAHEVYLYDGTDDILLCTFDTTNNRVSFTTAYNIYSNVNNNEIGPTATPVDGMSWDKGNARLTLSNTAGATLRLARHGSNGDTAQFHRNNSQVGSISVTTTATTYNTSSDYRLKYDVEAVADYGDLSLSGPLGKLMRLRPVKYRMYNDETAALLYGFIAHELQEEVPHAVTGFKDETTEEDVVTGYVDDAANPDGPQLPVTERRQVPVYQGIDHSQIMSLAVAAIQQLAARVVELETRLEAMQ